MESNVKDFFINILIAVLIILIVYYLFTTLGWMKIIANDCYTTVPMTGPDGVKNYDEEKMKNCQKDAEEKQKLVNIKRSVVSGVLGIALLFNNYFVDLNKYGMKGDLNIGLSLSGFYLILMSITDYFQYLPDIFKLILLILFLFFVLKIYTTKKIV